MTPLMLPNEQIVTAASQGTGDTATLRRPDHELARQLARIKQLPADQQFAAICALFTAYVDQHASTSQQRHALPFASGFRTLCVALQSQHAQSQETETLGRFLSGWAQALMSQDAVVNPPKATNHGAEEGGGVTLSWQRGDRSLEITFIGPNTTYGATSFTADRRLEYQDGNLALTESSLRRTIAWLVGQPLPE